jgi:hypothetical protein
MLEFLEGAVYVAGNNGTSDFAEFAPPSHLPVYLESGLEVQRSIWDRDSLIAHLDLEYHDFDNPAAPWIDPEQAFQLQQPVLDAALQVLGKAGIVPLILVSGRGFHLVWAVRRGSTVFRQMAGLGYVPRSLEHRYSKPCSPDGASVDIDLGRAFAGLGLVVEFIWHCVLAEAERNTSLPIQPATIEVGPGSQGRHIVVFDLSEYGDPLHVRQIRLPFSAYLKPRRFEWLLGENEVRHLLPIFEIPLNQMSPAEAVRVARDPDAVIELSRRATVAIPDASEPMGALLNAYQTSELRTFHDKFYRQLPDQEIVPVETEPIGIPDAPGCVQWLLEHPNDWLLKPAGLQHVVRVLMALGWNPGWISRVINAAYLKDCDWRDVWVRLDPSNRAIFYTRLFAGMIVTGSDKLIDFNCVSHQEKGYCTIPDCRLNLVAYRDMLLKLL